MALELTDFGKASNLSLQDIREALPKGSAINDRSASMLAAKQSLLVDPTEEQYKSSKAELLDPANREAFILREEAIRKSIYEDAQATMMGALSDPTVPDAEKMKLYNGYTAITTSELPPLNTDNTLAEQAVIAESTGETAEAAEGRSLFLDSISKVNDSKRKLSSMISALEIAEDQGIANTVVDMAELIAPLAEWVHVDQMLNEVVPNSDQALLLGQKKEQLYETIKGYNVEQRAAFAEQIIAMVQDNENIILPDGNALMALESLQRMLIDNDYSNVERWFDNATSVLDVIGLGAGARSILKSGKAAKIAGKFAKTARKAPVITDATGKALADEAAAFKSATPPTDPALQAEADAFKAADAPTDPALQAEADKFADTPENLGPAANALEDEALNFKLDKNKPGKVSKLEEEAVAFKPTTLEEDSELAREALAYLTRTRVVPSSPSQIVKDANPDLARAMHETMATDETGEAAQALYGTTREDALAKDILPEPEMKKGTTPNKVEMTPVFKEPEDLRATRRADGNMILNDSELSRVKDKLTEGIKNVEGIVLHPSSLVVRTNLDGSIGFTARYSPPDAGFADPTRAIEAAKFAFRKYGMTEDNFSLLARRGDEWVETNAAELAAENQLRAAGVELGATKPNEFAIGMKYDHRVGAGDIEDVDLLTTAPGWISRIVQVADRVPTQALARLGQGSLVQNLLDAASVIHPQIVGAASVAVDKAVAMKKLYVEQFAKFTETYNKLAKPRRAVMTDYIHEANLKGIPFNTTDLYSRGFNEAEVEALKTWRQANDAMWFAANDDMVDTLKAQNVKVFSHEATDTHLMGRPMARGSVGARSELFDATDNSVKSISKEDLDTLYEQKGEIIRLLEPIEIDGRTIDMVISRNTPSAGYTRALADGEKVLAYRDGYYPVMYDANFFITKKVKGAGGEEFTRVVASARNRSEVNAALKGIKASEGLSDEEFNAIYSFRKDRRLENTSNSLFDEGSWNVSVNSGLTTQRVRGKRLGDAGAQLHNMGNAHLVDPLEAVTAQIQQLSRRTSMRKFLDTSKKRWLLSYGKHLDLPVNPKTGQVDVPKNISGVKGKAGASEKIVADARTNYNYISSLENGFINGIDAAYKAAINLAADLMGGAGFAKGEEALLGASKVSPITAAKTAAFKLFISANPARQAIIQRSQMLMVGATNFDYFKSGMVKDLIGLNNVRFGASKNPKYLALLEEVKASGILEAVDANTLVRDDMLRMAEFSFQQKAAAMANRPFEFMQKIGFDAAEQDVLLSAWLAHRDLAIKAGKNVKSQRVKDEILAATRGFTLQMNRAGEMPYSQNTLGLVAQFFSFRHKAMLQGLTNRNLKPADRAKLLAYTTAMFGVDATLISAGVDALFPEKEPSEYRDRLKDGLLDTTLNYALTLASGEDQMIDFGDLAPTEAFGTFNVFSAMLTTPLAEVLAESPSGSLLFGANPRITEMFKTGFKYFVPYQNYEDPEMKVKLSDVAMSAANLFSGFSNIFKARYAYHMDKKISGSGKVTDSDVSNVEALFASLGFRTKTETGYQALNEELLGGVSFEENDIKMWYNEFKRILARRGETVEESGLARNIISEAWRVFGEDRPRAVKSILTAIENDAKDRDYTVLKGLLSKMGVMPDEDVWKLINTLPPGEVRDKASEMLKTREEFNNGS